MYLEAPVVAVNSRPPNFGTNAASAADGAMPFPNAHSSMTPQTMHAQAMGGNRATLGSLRHLASVAYRYVLDHRSVAVRSGCRTAVLAGDHMEASPKRRPVVTAFVQRADGKVLLVQRSNQVRTYQGLWGAVSGGVEGQESILHRALTEVEEETGIPRDQLCLVATGRPLPVDDAGRHFLVYPFLLRSLIDKPHVSLNWENVASQWVDHSGLKELPTVPLLSTTLRRLALPPHLQRHVDALEADREHGAAELAIHVLQAFEAAAQHKPEHGEVPGELLETWRNFTYRLATCRPSMAAIANTACDVMLELEQRVQELGAPSTQPPDKLRKVLEHTVRKVGERMTHARQSLAGQVADNLLAAGGTVMTLSYSSSVVSGVALAAQQVKAGTQQHAQPAVTPTPSQTVMTANAPCASQPGVSASEGVSPGQVDETSPSRSIHAIVCESRPLLEGLKTAQRLAEAGVATTVVTDAQAAVFVRKADVVIFGADSIMQEGAVNKVGSHLLALAAHEAGIPVYAVADTSKVSPAPVTDVVLPNTVLAAGHEEKDPDEVTACWPADVAALAGQQRVGVQDEECQEGVAALSVRNVYFEVVPMSLLAGVVTEVGVLTPADIAERLKERRQQYFQALHIRPQDVCL